MFDVTNYPTSTSDIEALLVFDHQVRMQYVLLESSYKLRQALFDSEQSSDQEASDDLKVLLKEVTETIVDAAIASYGNLPSDLSTFSFTGNQPLYDALSNEQEAYVRTTVTIISLSDDA